MRVKQVNNFARAAPTAGRALILAILLSICVLARGEEPSREYGLKAAFIYNFAQFTVWPDSAFSAADAPFIVAVIGTDPFGDALQAVMEGKKIGNHPVLINHLKSDDEIKGCHLLFVPASQQDKYDSIFKAVADLPILTVGETQDILPAGGAIRFLIEDNKIRFEVNLDSAKKAGLKISSKLLSLAKIYKP
jgi:hypothetical protein